MPEATIHPADDMAEAPPAARPAQAAPARAAPRLHPQLEAILDKLDARATLQPAFKLRSNPRLRYRRARVPVRVYHPGGSIIQRHVLTRDLSAEGLSFLHNGYLHIGTRVDVTLVRHESESANAGAEAAAAGTIEDAIQGVVVRCVHLGRSWHLVGVKLAARIFTQLYLDPRIDGLPPSQPAAGEPTAAGAPPVASEAPSPPSVAA